jgi:hypothetical protein
MDAAGVENPDKRRRGQELHEVWEFHDGEDVITLWDRCMPVQAGPNPYWHGEIRCDVPADAVMHELLGIGEPEAIEDLQEEMNTLRSQRVTTRRWCCSGRSRTSMGSAIRVISSSGRARCGRSTVTRRSSSSRSRCRTSRARATRRRRGCRRTSSGCPGINDMEAGAGASGAGETATGAQLVHAAANVRIQNKTIPAGDGGVTPQAQQMLALLQQKITEEHGHRRSAAAG